MKKSGILERLRAKKAKRDLLLGVAWYSEEQWGRVTARAVDPDLFEATYAEWTKMAEEALEGLRSSVGHPIKVYVEADELAAWCLAHGRRTKHRPGQHSRCTSCSGVTLRPELAVDRDTLQQGAAQSPSNSYRAATAPTCESPFPSNGP